MKIQVTDRPSLETALYELMGSEANKNIVTYVADQIQTDQERPGWGSSEWEGYLATLDLWDIANSRKPASWYAD